MAKVFISYRRDDSGDVCDRIYEHLRRHFRKRDIFIDIDDIPQGVNFRTYVEQVLTESDVALVIIGRNWESITDQATGQRRLDLPDDPVRVEAETALARNVPVIPVLVQGAVMPTAEHLPPSMRSLADQNGLVVRRNPDFYRDVERLARAVRAAAALHTIQKVPAAARAFVQQVQSADFRALIGAFLLLPALMALIICCLLLTPVGTGDLPVSNADALPADTAFRIGVLTAVASAVVGMAVVGRVLLQRQGQHVTPDALRFDAALLFFLGSPNVLLAVSVTVSILADAGGSGYLPFVYVVGAGGVLAFAVLVYNVVLLWRVLSRRATSRRATRVAGLFYQVVLGLSNPIVILGGATTSSHPTGQSSLSYVGVGFLSELVALIPGGLIGIPVAILLIRDVGRSPWRRLLVMALLAPIVIPGLELLCVLLLLPIFGPSNVIGSLAVYGGILAAVMAYWLWPTVLFAFGLVGPLNAGSGK